MLKIKDEVDLKELERFGFIEYAPILQPELKEYRPMKCRISIYGDVVPVETDYVFPRRIVITSCSNKTITLLYDLIQAGLVEKI